MIKQTLKIRALIVDDEPFARERVRQLLDGDPEIEIAGECGDGLQAIAMINEQAPDLLFLDVQMPELVTSMPSAPSRPAPSIICSNHVLKIALPNRFAAPRRCSA
jgi:DNA-binding NarL/FixJ family response regulator